MYLKLLNAFAQICCYFFPAKVMAQAGEGEPLQVTMQRAPRCILHRIIESAKITVVILGNGACFNMSFSFLHDSLCDRPRSQTNSLG